MSVVFIVIGIVLLAGRDNSGRGFKRTKARIVGRTTGKAIHSDCLFVEFEADGRLERHNCAEFSDADFALNTGDELDIFYRHDLVAGVDTWTVIADNGRNELTARVRARTIYGILMLIIALLILVLTFQWF